MSDDRRRAVPWWEQFRPIIVVTAEISSLLLVAGALLSVALNTALFGRWDINFLSVATPGDILMSGLNILRRTIVWLFFTSPVAIVIFFSTRRILAVDNRALYVRVIVLFLALMWLVLFCASFRESDFRHWNYPVEGNESLYLTVIVAVATVAFAVAVLSKRPSRDATFATIAGSLFLTVSIYSIIYRIPEGDHLLFVKINPSISGCIDPRAEWIGLDTVVARCTKRDGEPGQYLVVARDSVILMSPTTKQEEFSCTHDLVDNEKGFVFIAKKNKAPHC